MGKKCQKQQISARADAAPSVNFQKLDVEIDFFLYIGLDTFGVFGSAFFSWKWFLFKECHAITSNISGLRASISHRRNWGIPKSNDGFGFVSSDWGLIFQNLQIKPQKVYILFF